MRIVWLSVLLLLSAASASGEQVPLEREHGMYMVPVRINRAVSIPFVLDSEQPKSEALHPADFTIRQDGIVRLNPELARTVTGIAYFS